MKKISMKEKKEHRWFCNFKRSCFHNPIPVRRIIGIFSIAIVILLALSMLSNETSQLLTQNDQNTIVLETSEYDDIDSMGFIEMLQHNPNCGWWQKPEH